MPKTFFITTAIDYTNSPPHIGHAYEKVLADVIARYRRLKGDKVFFLTGVDQHGQKVQQSAAKAGVPPAEFVKEITQKFVGLWKKLDVQYDEWAETTSDRHKKVVQGILQRLFDAGQIYKDKQAGYYSIRQEQFLTDKERGPDGEFGPEWGQIEFREEENYYFKLSQHKEWLLSYLDNRRDAVIHYISFAGYDPNASAVATGLRPVETDASSKSLGTAHRAVATSEFDAQPQEFRDRWSKDTLQIIGKDILIPAHGIYWLIMLHAIGFPDDQMPQLLVHGWWNLGGAKMSKSAGNIIDPFVLIDKYGSDALRYYLISEIATGSDADFREGFLVAGYNHALANTMGNLANRTLNMIHRFRHGTIKSIDLTALAESEVRSHLQAWSDGELKAGQTFYRDKFADFRPSNALSAPLARALACNALVEISAPWNLAKDKQQEKLLDAVLYHLAESLRIIAIWISPVLPKAAHGIFDQLNWKMELSGKDERFKLDDAQWGDLPDGHVVGKPVPLFPRIEIA